MYATCSCCRWYVPGDEDSGECYGDPPTILVTKLAGLASAEFTTVRPVGCQRGGRSLREPLHEAGAGVACE